jgi:hypothetical protein
MSFEFLDSLFCLFCFQFFLPLPRKEHSCNIFTFTAFLDKNFLKVFFIAVEIVFTCSHHHSPSANLVPMTSSFPLSFSFPLCVTGQGSAYISWQGNNLHDFSLSISRSATFGQPDHDLTVVLEPGTKCFCQPFTPPPPLPPLRMTKIVQYVKRNCH